MPDSQDQQDNQKEDKKRPRITINDVTDSSFEKWRRFKVLLMLQQKNIPQGFDEAIELYLQKYQG